MSYELIATLMFSTMMLMLLTGQRVFGAIGFVAVVAALLLWWQHCCCGAIRGGMTSALPQR